MRNNWFFPTVSRRAALTVTAAVLLAMVVASAWAWTRIPADARIPLHWQSGVPDRFGGRTEALLTAPVLAVAFAALFAALPWLARRFDVRWSVGGYTQCWVLLMLVLGGVHAAILAVALGPSGT